MIMFTRKTKSLPTKLESKSKSKSKRFRSSTSNAHVKHFILFKTKEELNIKSKNFVFYTSTEPSASHVHYYYYKEKNSPCERYFVTNAKYIGIVINRIFYIVNLIDDAFTKKVKTIFNKINHKDIEYLIHNLYSTADSNPYIIFDFETWKSKNEDIQTIETQITNFEFISPPKCVKKLDLSMAKKTLSHLNANLNCTGYKFDIGFVNDMENNTEISMFSANANGLCLCMFHNDSCISSISFYKSNETPNTIKISSFTKPVDDYAENNLNKLLRAVAILIAKDLYPDIKNIESFAINPVSAYLMIKYLNGKIILDKDYEDDEEYTIEINKIHNNKSLTYQDISNFYDTVLDDLTIVVKINEKNIKNAEKVSSTIIENLCDALNLTYHTASEDLDLDLEPYYTASDNKLMSF